MELGWKYVSFFLSTPHFFAGLDTFLNPPEERKKKRRTIEGKTRWKKRGGKEREAEEQNCFFVLNRRERKGKSVYPISAAAFQFVETNEKSAAF